jgi:Na+-transporting NADH:ubiquinone oxidoreductase subunit NqrD
LADDNVSTLQPSVMISNNKIIGIATAIAIATAIKIAIAITIAITITITNGFIYTAHLY